MAICPSCEQEMLEASSCSVEALHMAGVAVPLPRYGEEVRYGRWPRKMVRCGDCGVQPGGHHHLGCDVAECPSCGRQLISCVCRYDEDPPDEDDDQW
jgi:hypothetical protein